MMEPHEKNAGKILDKALGLYSKPSPEQMESARDHALKRLESEPGQPCGDVVSFQEPSSPRSNRSMWRPALAVVAAAAAFAVVTAVIWRSGDSAVRETASGPRKIALGETVNSNDSAGTVITLPDGSRVELRVQTDLSLERAADGLRIRLTKGGIIVNAAKQGAGHLYVQTKDVTVSVVGTVFLVNAEERGSRVAVIQGEVQVQQGATLKKLIPGDQIATSPLMESHAVSEEILWSRNAEAHLSLLQQSAVPTKAVPITEPRLTFDVVSIRPSNPGASGGRGGGPGGPPGGCTGVPRVNPNRFEFVGTTTYNLVTLAYGMGLCLKNAAFDLLSGGPKWIRSDRFDIQAVIPEGTVTDDSQLHLTSIPSAKLQTLLQNMLADRFKLAVHRETREMPVYALTVANGGPRLQVLEEGSCIPQPRIDPSAPPPRPVAGEKPWCGTGGIGIKPDRSKVAVNAQAMTLDDFSALLGPLLDRPVLNNTGISGVVAFRMEFAYDQTIAGGFLARAFPGQELVPFVPGAPADPSGPSIFNAFQEQLGLKLEATRAPVEVLVIDRVEKPSEN